MVDSENYRIDNHLNPNNIVPGHRAWRKERIAELVKSMFKHGWNGRPLLVINSDRYYALTGAHRIMAARMVGVNIPVTFIDDKKLRDDVIVEVLRRSGDTVAANLLREEWSNFTLENADEKMAATA